MEEFRESSKKFNEELCKETRQQHGIFFTPKTARERLFQILDNQKVSPTSILEPSFGSGEFLDDLYEKYPDAEIHGVELNEDMYNAYPKKDNLVNESIKK